MERHEITELLGQLKLAGMRASYDEVVAAGVRASPRAKPHGIASLRRRGR